MPVLTAGKTSLRCLSGNALKLIAAVSMLLDHIGMILLPQYVFLRGLGRIAFPVFAFLIAEGCRYTRSPLRYLFNLFLLGVVCQAGSIIGSGRWVLCVPCSFFLGAALLLCLMQVSNKDAAVRQKTGFMALAVLITAGAVLLCATVGIDYGFTGVLLPLLAGLSHKKWLRLAVFGAGLILLSAAQGYIQGYCLFALLLLAMYNEKRGTLPLKWFFYIFYPVHLAVLWGLSLLLKA